MGRRDRDEQPKWGKRTPPKSERAAAAEALDADEKRRKAGLSRSAEALRTPSARVLGEKSRFLGVDLGLATGIAVYNRDDEIAHVHSVILEGGGDLAEVWQRAAVHRGIHLRIVQAHHWRARFFYPREHRSGPEAKAHAIKMAAQVVDWSETRGVSGASLGHDAAEAVMVGLFGVIDAGWLADPPRFRR
jgi:glutamate-1-semialdehyde aminotransferase